MLKQTLNNMLIKTNRRYYQTQYEFISLLCGLWSSRSSCSWKCKKNFSRSCMADPKKNKGKTFRAKFHKTQTSFIKFILNATAVGHWCLLCAASNHFVVGEDKNIFNYPFCLSDWWIFIISSPINGCQNSCLRCPASNAGVIIHKLKNSLQSFMGISLRDKQSSWPLMDKRTSDVYTEAPEWPFAVCKHKYDSH